MAVQVQINSAVVIDPSQGIDKTQSGLLVSGSLTLSGNYGTGSPVTDGDVIDFSGADNAALLTSGQPPRWMRIYQEPTAGNDPVPYLFLYARGTEQNDCRLSVMDDDLAPLTPGAYPAALTDDDPSPNIRFEASFPLFI